MNRIAQCRLDHLVVTAPGLAAGVEWVESILGVPLQAGGTHVRMGTHNAVLRLSDSTYLEVLAPDPGAPAPSRPRWFELDQMSSDARPRLAAWLARTEDARSASAACLGDVPVEAMTRGSLEWLITVPADGSLLFGGAVPFLIQWLVSPHPASAMADRGCALVSLEVHHPDPDAVSRTLECLAVDGPIAVMPRAQPGLVVRIETPWGVRSIGEGA